MVPRPGKVEFIGHQGLKIAGLFQAAPATEVRQGVVLAHCFTCSKDFKVLAWISRGLAERGYSSLRFDFSGLGESEGDFRRTTLSTDIEDLAAAVRWMEAQGIETVALLGHSLGGAAAILAASRLPAVRSVVVLGTSWQVGWRVRQLLTPVRRRMLEETGEVELRINDRDFPITAAFLSDLERHSLKDVVATWDKGFLVVHGVEDDVVPLADSQLLFSSARNPKAFISVPDAGHLFAESRTRAHALSAMIAGWIGLQREAGA